MTEASVSPLLFFMRDIAADSSAKRTIPSPSGEAPVTVRLERPPDNATLTNLENHGLTFKRMDSELLHTEHIYCATVELDSLESIARFASVVRIESVQNFARCSTLDVSNSLVQADRVRQLTYQSAPLDGTGIVVANVDTGVDIYHPAFFKEDGGTFGWIDVNQSGAFESGTDAVDLNLNGIADPDETLRFLEASFIDEYSIMHNPSGTYDADIDWLYNDGNGNGIRDYGPDAGYTDQSPSFGELIFIIGDSNENNALDTGEYLTALGTSKFIAAYDKTGRHTRGVDLLLSSGDKANHGTPSFGIVGGQAPGRRFIGMSPGVEFISINRLEVEDIFEAILWARNLGADIIMYEFGSWVGEFLDGSSNLETFIEDLYDEGIHQFTAAGNLAGQARKKHANFFLESGNTETLRFSVPASYQITEVYFSLLWRNRSLFYPVTTLTLPTNENVRIIPGTFSYGIYTIRSGIDTSDSTLSPPAGTSRLDIVISAENGFSGDFTFTFRNARSLDLEFDAYIADNRTMWMHGTQFMDHLTDDGTVCSPGTAKKGITVGSYDPRGYHNPFGSLSDFSSWGDTIDGRRAVDITAPGFTVFSPASSQFTGKPGGYVDFNGTSAALPHVVGCAALIMQASPGITPDMLSQVLLDYALEDEFTGTVPNTMWGYGKLRSYASITESGIVSPPSLVLDTGNPAIFRVSEPSPNPFNVSTAFQIDLLTTGTSSFDVAIYNIIGQTVRSVRIDTVSSPSYRFTWDGLDDRGKTASSGIYFFRFTCMQSTIIRRALLYK